MTRDIKATVEELERLEREATKGPWAPDVTASYPGGDYGCSGVECLEEHAYPLWKEVVAKSWTQTICTTPHDSRYGKGEQARTNMEFIAAARNALPSLLAELRRCWDMIERARKESKTDGDMQRLLSEFSLRSDNRAMARELEQASAKLVEQQNEIVRLRAIEEAAVRYREASEAYQELKLSADMAAVNYAHRRNAEAREDLFAALPPRKEDA